MSRYLFNDRLPQKRKRLCLQPDQHLVAEVRAVKVDGALDRVGVRVVDVEFPDHITEHTRGSCSCHGKQRRGDIVVAPAKVPEISSQPKVRDTEAVPPLRDTVHFVYDKQTYEPLFYRVFKGVSECLDLKPLGGDQHQNGVLSTDTRVEDGTGVLNGGAPGVKRGDAVDPRRLAEAARGLALLARRTAQRTEGAVRSLDAATDQIGGVRRDLDKVRRELATDPLTGLANRRHFELRLGEEIALARETGDPLTVMLVDVEGFDAIAATHGPGIGDQVLRLVGKTLADGVRGRDVAARFGAQRFAVALPHTTESESGAIAEQIRNIVSGRRIVRRDNREAVGRIALSVSRATLQPGEDIGRLIARAEAGLDGRRVRSAR